MNTLLRSSYLFAFSIFSLHGCIFGSDCHRGDCLNPVPVDGRSAIMDFLARVNNIPPSDNQSGLSSPYSRGPTELSSECSFAPSVQALFVRFSTNFSGESKSTSDRFPIDSSNSCHTPEMEQFRRVPLERVLPNLYKNEMPLDEVAGTPSNPDSMPALDAFVRVPLDTIFPEPHVPDSSTCVSLSPTVKEDFTGFYSLGDGHTFSHTCSTDFGDRYQTKPSEQSLYLATVANESDLLNLAEPLAPQPLLPPQLILPTSHPFIKKIINMIQEDPILGLFIQIINRDERCCKAALNPAKIWQVLDNLLMKNKSRDDFHQSYYPSDFQQTSSPIVIQPAFIAWIKYSETDPKIFLDCFTSAYESVKCISDPTRPPPDCVDTQGRIYIQQGYPAWNCVKLLVFFGNLLELLGFTKSGDFSNETLQNPLESTIFSYIDDLVGSLVNLIYFKKNYRDYPSCYQKMVSLLCFKRGNLELLRFWLHHMVRIGKHCQVSSAIVTWTKCLDKRFTPHIKDTINPDEWELVEMWVICMRKSSISGTITWDLLSFLDDMLQSLDDAITTLSSIKNLGIETLSNISKDILAAKSYLKDQRQITCEKLGMETAPETECSHQPTQAPGSLGPKESNSPPASPSPPILTFSSNSNSHNGDDLPTSSLSMDQKEPSSSLAQSTFADQQDIGIHPDSSVIKYLEAKGFGKTWRFCTFEDSTRAGALYEPNAVKMVHVPGKAIEADVLNKMMPKPALGQKAVEEERGTNASKTSPISKLKRDAAEFIPQNYSSAHVPSQIR